jgi:hypothetical protein
MLIILSLTELVALVTSDTSTTSAITPIIIPSIVRKALDLLAAMDFSAIFID